MLGKKGQSALETVAIAVILLGLFLATAIVMTQRNADAGRLNEINNDSLQCEAISRIITNFNSNKDYSETMIRNIEKNAKIEMGSISIGTIYCRYMGEAWLRTETGYIDDTAGFDLEKGKMYKVWIETGKGVIFCDVSWC
jgi:hypothetical protein